MGRRLQTAVAYLRPSFGSRYFQLCRKSRRARPRYASKARILGSKIEQSRSRPRGSICGLGADLTKKRWKMSRLTVWFDPKLGGTRICPTRLTRLLPAIRRAHDQRGIP